MAGARSRQARAVSSRALAARPQSPPAGWLPIWIWSRTSVRGSCDHGSLATKVIFRGGFVDMNLADTLLACGHEVTLSDRKELPAAVQRSFAGGETQCGKLVGDSTPGRHDCGFVV